jgi:hypothetical protein
MMGKKRQLENRTILKKFSWQKLISIIFPRTSPHINVYIINKTTRTNKKCDLMLENK